MIVRDLLSAVFLPAFSLITLTAPTNAQTQSGPTSSPWNGFYVGADVGAGFQAGASTQGTMAHTGLNNVGANTGVAGPTTSWSTGDSRDVNMLGGVSLGYNRQITPQLVAGFVTDIDLANIRNTGRASSFVPLGVNATVAHTVDVAVTQKTDWFGTVRGRLGITPVSKLLLYGTGGLAYGNVGNSVSVRDTYAIPAVLTGSAAESKTKLGWTAGAGTEYVFAKNWAMKAEWLYVDLGKSTINGVNNVELVGPTPFPIFTTSHEVHNNFHVIRVGLNRRFGE